MRKSVCVVAVVAVMAFAAIATAQTTNVEVRRGVVVSAYGNNVVVKHSDGVVREHQVPEGFTFNIDGKDLKASELKPGMILTATITTTTTPKVVYSTEVRQGEVLKVVGRTLVVRTAEGTKTFRDVPSDFVFLVDGREMSVYDLRPGMRLTATVVHESVVEEGETDLQVAGTAAAIKQAEAKKQQMAAAPAAPASTSSYQTLPKTGSQLPLVGLAGLVLLALSCGIALTRRLF